MARRRSWRPGDWGSVAGRLDEILCAHGGDDPLDGALELLAARLAAEATSAPLARGQGAALVAHVEGLLGEARRRWPGILEPGPLSLGPEALARCAEVLEGERLLDGDLEGLDAVFENLVSKASKGQKGQYFTPRHVISEIVAMVSVAPGERVLDPACGSGGFLRHALRLCPGCEVWGLDIDPRAARVARVMLAASGQPPGRVCRLDSLRLPGGGAEAAERVLPGPADVILTNPPFAGDVGDTFAGAYELASRPGVERDVLFVERCVGLLRPGGRLALVLPYNKVGSPAWAYARRWLLERVRVVAVLGLGRNTFRPHTGQKAYVVVGVKRPEAAPPGGDEEIFFFISERDGKDDRGRLRLSGGVIDHDLGEATAEVRSRLQRAAAGALWGCALSAGCPSWARAWCCRPSASTRGAAGPFGGVRWARSPRSRPRAPRLGPSSGGLRC